MSARRIHNTPSGTPSLLLRLLGGFAKTENSTGAVTGVRSEDRKFDRSCVRCPLGGYIIHRQEHLPCSCGFWAAFEDRKFHRSCDRRPLDGYIICRREHLPCSCGFWAAFEDRKFPGLCSRSLHFGLSYACKLTAEKKIRSSRIFFFQCVKKLVF